jgi:ATP/ADP translocase
VAGGLLSDPYIRLIFGMYIFFALGSLFIDNIFFAQIENHLTNQDQMASFLGTFSGVVGGLSLFSQMFLASGILSRYGVRIAILLTPMLLLVGACLMPKPVSSTHSGSNSCAPVVAFAAPRQWHFCFPI